jgi:hypothetical protein
MRTLTNPNVEQIQAFAKRIEESLLAARERGSLVEIAYDEIVVEEFNRLMYGDCPVDFRYIGAEFVAKFRERGYENAKRSA